MSRILKSLTAHPVVLPKAVQTKLKRDLKRLRTAVSRTRACEKRPLGKPTTTKVINHLEVKLSCGGVISAPITVSNPAGTTPVIYVATFPPHPFCGTNSQSLINADTGKALPDGVVIFPPHTTAVADQYACAQHPDLAGCEGQGPSSQTFVYGITVTRG